ncbi:hypothetical protein FS749_012561 [Ceratobasidium sp. UAMH 11750]|nr:hypothetical protein FS749_012561 [Ceratobasidium sp. UAMH 11750]
MMYEELSGNQRRVRHIQGIYVKNLTPFPIRDHASSALQHALPAPILQHSDDTDLALARRRSRRTSQNSIVTLRTARAEAHRDESPEKHSTLETPRARTRPAGPPVSFPRAGPSGSPPAHLRRQRSTSHASLGSQASGTHSRDVPHSGLPTSPSATAGSFFHYPSQRNLEKVMSSRLVETFVTLSTLETTMSKPVRSNGGDLLKAPSSPTGDRSPVRGSPARRFPPPNKVNPSKHSYHRSEPSLRPSDVSSGQTNDSKPANGTTKTAVTTLKSKRSAANGSARTLSTSSARPVNFPPTPSPPPTRSASPARSTHVEESSIPFFISSLHRPSTNPCWTELDAGGDFAEWTDRHQSQVTATLWGRVDECSASAWSNLKGKGKETGPDETDEGDWKILVEWDVQMDKLEKVEASLLDHPSHLPSNTLLLSLAPSGDLYFLPPSSPSRPASATGYASDSELASSSHKSKPPTRSEILQQSRRETRMKQSATWADIVKLSTLYTVVSDTKVSLGEVVQRTDAILDRGGPRLLARDMSEREEHIKALKHEISAVKQACVSATNSIQDRLDQLRARREALRAASEIYEEDVEANEEQTEQVHTARATYLSVHNALTPRRTTLCNTLESIFPIEPDAERAADLVFTIIGVPLSVPVAPSDPAPPLDNEEAVSAALGYAAHVVALLSAYLSVRVPYLVTYVGSRSYVRDPISAMHGPRMFPLYPTGVDTYRFEYAVFLLNKDIETLMAEQGLRAIDLRHTLPNLKNLILTLTTHNAGSTPPTIRVASIPLVAPNEDSAPTPRAASPVPSETLPTQAPAPTRSKFLSPLSAFLWSRPAATSNRPKVVVEIAEPIDDPEGATPTGTESQTPRSSESPANSSDISANSSTNEDESHEGEPKAISLPSPNGTEKLEDKVPAETPPSSPFSNTVT